MDLYEEIDEMIEIDDKMVEFMDLDDIDETEKSSDDDKQTRTMN
jgi:hypothetical protein